MSAYQLSMKRSLDSIIFPLSHRESNKVKEYTESEGNELIDIDVSTKVVGLRKHSRSRVP